MAVALAGVAVSRRVAKCIIADAFRRGKTAWKSFVQLHWPMSDDQGPKRVVSNTASHLIAKIR